MHHRQPLRWLAAALLLAGSVQAATVTSSFDTGTEGWDDTLNDAGTTNTWVNAGGNPGGFLQSDDSVDGWGYVTAPGSYLLGTALAGGALSFDLRVLHDPQDPINYRVRIGLSGGGLSLINAVDAPTTDWQTYTFNFTAGSGWRLAGSLNEYYDQGGTAPSEAQFASVLSNLTGLYIAADYTDGNIGFNQHQDATQLDNIVLRTPGTVPVAGTWALLLAAGLAAPLARRRRRG